MTLGDYIKEYRISHNYSMDDFAKRTGMSKAYISILERNCNPSTGKAAVPSLETIKRVAIATGVDFNDLIAMLDEDQEVLLDPIDLSLEDLGDPESRPVVVTGRAGSGKSNTIRKLAYMQAEQRTQSERMKQVFISSAHRDITPKARKFMDKILKEVNKETGTNMVYMVGRDGSYRDRKLSDMQFAALNAILDQMPEAIENK